MATFTAPPIPVPSPTVRHAELVFGGVEQAGPSFEGRVFLNRADADDRTPRTAEMGYAGSFHVYGHGAVEPPRLAAARDAGAAGPLAPIEKRVHADEAALRAALRGADELTVTVVSVVADPSAPPPERPFVELAVDFG